jgi:hypothetical protein
VDLRIENRARRHRQHSGVGNRDAPLEGRAKRARSIPKLEVSLDMPKENFLISDQPQPPAKAARVGVKFLFVSILLGLFKLWLVSGDEIVASYSPHDALWFIQSAKQRYWRGPYDAPFGAPSFIRPPAYPLFIALTKATGFPLRISTELLFLAAAFVFAVSIIKAGKSRLLAILLYAVIIFHPASFQVSSRATPDSFYACALLIALACMIILLLKRDDIYRLRYAILTGAVLAILWHIRQESVIILALLVVYGLIAVLTVGVGRKPRSPTLRQLGVIVLVPALVILLVSIAVNTINYAKFGVFAADGMSGPGFESANKALLRIQPMLPPVRFVAVPREVRLRAYQVSPAFQELKSTLEGPVGRSWASYARSVGVQVDGEISTPHFWWALNKGAYDIGYNKSPGQADQYFQRIADEINAACADGRLQCRWAFSSVLDPHVQNYLPYLPASFRRISGLFFQRYEPAGAWDERSLPPEVRELFDEMANRRAANTTPWMVHLSGWAANPNDNLQRIVVRDQMGRVLASTDQFTPRPDIVSSYAAQNIKIPENSGYSLEYPGGDAGEEIVFITQHGAEWVVPHTKTLSGIATQGSLIYAVDQDDAFVQSREHALRLRIQSFIGANYGRMTALLTFLSLASVLVLLFCYRSVNRKDVIYAILALLSATVITRVLFFTLIDASSWSTLIPRYYLPVMPLYTCVLLLLIGQAASAITMRVSRRDILPKILPKFLSGQATLKP